MTATRESKPRPPVQVLTSFWIMIGLAALLLIWQVISEFLVDWSKLATLATSNAGGASRNGAGVVALFITVQVIGFIGIAVTVLLAFLARNGYGVARTLLTILAALAVFSLVTSANVPYIIALGLRLFALVLLWLPASSEYFAAAKARRAQALTA